MNLISNQPTTTDSLLEGPDWDAVVDAVVAEAEIGQRVDDVLAA